MEAPQKVRRKPKQKAKVSKHETLKILQDATKPFWNSSYPYSCGQHFDSLKTKFLFLNQRRSLVMVVFFFCCKD